MLVDNPRVPELHEIIAENMRTQAEHFDDLLRENDMLHMMTQSERDYLSATTEAAPLFRECSRVLMKLAATSQRLIDEQNGDADAGF